MRLHTVTTGGALLGGDWRPTAVRVGWDTDDPMSVVLTFILASNPDDPAPWRIGRDLLIAGLGSVEPVGLGDVVLSRKDNLLWFTAMDAGTGICASARMLADPVVDLLARSCLLIAPGSPAESAAYPVQDTVEELFS